jgi:hypothetical protein
VRVQRHLLIQGENHGGSSPVAHQVWLGIGSLVLAGWLVISHQFASLTAFSDACLPRHGPGLFPNCFWSLRSEEFRQMMQQRTAVTTWERGCPVRTSLLLECDDVRAPGARSPLQVVIVMNSSSSAP